MANLNMLDILVQSTGAQEASRDLDVLAASGVRAEAATVRMGNALGTASNRAKTYQAQVQKAGMHTTNLTWQLNDIGVMLASGQNPFMLAMQQGTQITQIFSQMGGTGKQAFAGIVAAAKSMITPLNVLTIGAIAGGAALLYWARSAINGGEVAMTLEERIEDLAGTFKDYTSQLKELADNSALADRFGKDAEAARAFINELTRITSGELLQGFERTLSEFNDPFGLEDTMRGLQLGSVAGQLGLDRPFAVFTDDARDARDAVDELAQAGIDASNQLNSSINSGNFDEQTDAAKNLLSVYTELADADEIRTTAENDYIKSLTEVVSMMQEYSAASDKLSGPDLAFVEQIQKSIDLAEERLEAEQEISTDLQQRARLQSALNTLGSDSLGYLREQVAVERQIFEAQLDQLKTTDTRRTALLAEFDALKTIEEATFRIEAAKATAEDAAKHLQEVQGISAELKEQISLQRTLNAHGEESSQYRAVALQASQDALEAELDLVNASETQKTAILALNETWWLMSNPIDQAIDRTRGLTNMIKGANSMAMALVRNLGMVPTAMAGLGNDVVAQVESMRQANASLTDQIQNGTDARVAAVNAERDAILNRMEIDGVDMVAQMDRIATIDREIAELEGLAAINNTLTGELSAMTDATSEASGGTDKLSDAAKAASKSLEELEKAMTGALDDARTPLQVYNDGLRELAELADYAASRGVDFGQAYNVALQELQEELMASVPLVDELSSAFGDWVSEGFQDFKGMLDKMFQSFRSFIADMISTAISNPIKLAISGGGTGAGAAGGGGILSTLGAGGGLAGSFMAGGAGLATSLMGAGGGLASAGTYLSAVTTGATASMGSFAAAAGAVALPLLAVAAVFMAFKKTTKDLETGMRVTVEGMDTLVDSYKKVQTSRFFGLSKSVNDEFAAMDDVKADPVRDAVRVLQQGVVDAAASLGIGAEVFDGFSRSFTLSLKHMSDEEAQAVLQAELLNTQNAFADMIPTLTDFKIEGESTTGTLTRLMTNLTAVNESLYLFDRSALELSLASAGASSELIILSGGLDAFATKTQFIFENMLTTIQQESRLTEIATNKLNGTLGALGIAIPETHTEFMALLNAQDLLTVGGRNTHAALLDVAAAFVQVNGTAQSAADALDVFMEDHYRGLDDALTTAQQGLDTAQQGLEAAFSREMEATRETFVAKIGELQDSLSGARERLANSRTIADALKDALNDRVFPSVEAQRQSQDSASAYLRSLVGMGKIDDVDALERALSIVADPADSTYRTLEEYRRDFNMTSGVIQSLERTANIALSAEERAVLLLEQQIADAELQSDTAVNLLQQQLDGILGLGADFQTLADAIVAFQNASAVVKAATAAGTAGPTTSTNVDAGKDYSKDWTAEQWYYSNNPDVLTAVAQGVFSSAADHFQQYGKAEGRTFGKGPAFADGGEHLGGWRTVGEAGTELEYTGPSQIFSNGASKSLFDDSGMREELRSLRDEVSKLSSISLGTNRNTRVSAELATKRDSIGTDRSNAGEAILVKVVT